MKKCICERHGLRIPGILAHDRKAHQKAQRCDACERVSSDAAARKLVKYISQQPGRIVVQVRGGAVEEVYSEGPAEIAVLDFDDDETVIPGEGRASLQIRTADPDREYIEKIFSLATEEK